ncbi:MAG TPA: hexokinase [Bacillota bacterium]|nr:hexokinase [Bacillota bacterium]HOL09503.1 hexokinase [Bacillota bacterium]HPO97535.1 hexokinase [Bacillota bacterium]
MDSLTVVKDFLKKYQLDYEEINMEEQCRIFLAEMEQGLAGSGSLEMIPTFIEVGNEIPLNQRVIVLDAGGTNFRVATVYFDAEQKPVIEDFKKYSMPGIERELDKTTFFATMAEYVKDVIDKSDRIGFCFSYPTAMNPNKDGKVIRFSKEVKAKEVEGELIGENLKKALADLGFFCDSKKIVILNDTVATLVGGQVASRGRAFDSYIGFILGTGTNCCYIEKNANIVKNQQLDPDKSQIINVESGGYRKAPQSLIDLEYDRSTVNPGMATFEKMISGRYLGDICTLVIRHAATDGIFTSNVSERLKTITVNTIDINNYICNPFNKANDNPVTKALSEGNSEDYERMYHLIDRVVERAAKLVAISLAAMVLKSGKGQNPCYPVCITAEGTTFHQFKGLRAKTEYYLKQYMVEEKQRYYEMVSVENATLIGAAIAGLTN